MDRNFIECHQCGATVHKGLAPQMMQEISYNPYDYIVYCNDCKKNGLRRDEIGYLI